MPNKEYAQALLSFENVHWTNRIEIAHLHVKQGDCLHILGANGAGKSSLLTLLAGFETPQQGQVCLNQSPIMDYSLLELSKIRCYLAQQQSTEFDIPIGQLLSFYSQQSGADNYAIDDELEAYLSLNSFLHKPLSRLSGGQQQRFHIARVLLQIWPAVLRGEAIIVLDEPIAQLDINYQQKVLQLLRKLCRQGNTVIMSCHDINLSAQYANKVALLKQGEVLLHGGVEQVLTKKNLALAFECEFKEIIDPKSQQKYLISAQSSTI